MDVQLTAFVIYQDAAERQIDHKNMAIIWEEVGIANR
jgi:hypothetical protein